MENELKVSWEISNPFGVLKVLGGKRKKKNVPESPALCLLNVVQQTFSRRM